MSVHIPRPEYANALNDWHRTRLALGGRSAILTDPTQFLPMPESHKRPENRDLYRLYTERAFWYGGSARTLDAWVGTLTRKPLTVEVPSQFEWRLTNIDGQGNDVNYLARQVVRDVCAYARIGLLVDIGNAESASNPRQIPYIATYNNFSIISWRTRGTVEGRILDQVVLQEELEEPHPSGFGVIKEPMYRVLELDENGWYRARLFVMREGKSLERGEPIYPTRGGAYLNFIPFIFVTPTGTGYEIEKAPLQDVIDANVSHYQSSADREFSLYWSASPTVVLTGLGEDPNSEGNFTVGSGNLWKLPTGATADYLEFSGPGLAAIQETMKDKQQLMASLGANLLNAPKREAETFEALQLKSSGESASLVTIADAVSKALTAAVKMATYWSYLEYPVKVELNRDLLNVRLSPEDRKVLMLEYQSGLLSAEDYYYNLAQGEILRPGVTPEEARDAAQMQAPLLVSSFRPAPVEREVPVKKVANGDVTPKALTSNVETPKPSRRRR